MGVLVESILFRKVNPQPLHPRVNRGKLMATLVESIIFWEINPQVLKRSHSRVTWIRAGRHHLCPEGG